MDPVAWFFVVVISFILLVILSFRVVKNIRDNEMKKEAKTEHQKEALHDATVKWLVAMANNHLERGFDEFQAQVKCGMPFQETVYVTELERLVSKLPLTLVVRHRRGDINDLELYASVFSHSLLSAERIQRFRDPLFARYEFMREVKIPGRILKVTFTVFSRFVRYGGSDQETVICELKVENIYAHKLKVVPAA